MCVHISGEEGVWYVCDVMFAVFYVRVNCFVGRGRAVSRKFMNVCNSDMLLICTLTIISSGVCVLIVEGMSVVVNVMLSLTIVMSQPPDLVVKLCNLVVFAIGKSLVS